MTLSIHPSPSSYSLPCLISIISLHPQFIHDLPVEARHLHDEPRHGPYAGEKIETGTKTAGKLAIAYTFKHHFG